MGFSSANYRADFRYSRLRIQQDSARWSALAPRTALAQGRTGSGRSFDDEASSHMESNHARAVPARFSHGRRSFPIMLFRRALKHLLSMTNNGCQNASQELR